MTTITRIAIAGTDVDLQLVDHQVGITHGRGGITDSPAASTCQITLVGDGLPAVDLSASLVVEAYGLPRFAGVVTDTTPRQSTDGRGALAIVGIGPLADLALEPVTATAWPEESSGDRAQRILDAVGVPVGIARGAFTVLAMDGVTRTALDLLTELAESTGAALFDTPAGACSFQDLLARRQSYIANTWATMAGTWADQSGTWADQRSLAVAQPVEIPAACIAWQPTMSKKRGAIVNAITVEYGTGSPRPSVHEESAASITRHKRRDGGVLSTLLATEADATLRAENIITRQALPRLQLGNVTVLVHDLDDTTRTDVMGLVCGSRAVVKGLPAAYPVTDWLGVVEGWSETYATDAYGRQLHTLGLALSDPLASFAGLKWSEIPAGTTWADIPSGRIWADLTTTELLTV